MGTRGNRGNKGVRRGIGVNKEQDEQGLTRGNKGRGTRVTGVKRGPRGAGGNKLNGGTGELGVTGA